MGLEIDNMSNRSSRSNHDISLSTMIVDSSQVKHLHEIISIGEAINFDKINNTLKEKRIKRKDEVSCVKYHPKVE